jgi:hypothetical protein
MSAFGRIPDDRKNPCNFKHIGFPSLPGQSRNVPGTNGHIGKHFGWPLPLLACPASPPVTGQGRSEGGAQEKLLLSVNQIRRPERCTVTEHPIRRSRSKPMPKISLVVAFAVVMALAPAYAADKADWCTDAHMKQMDDAVTKMTDADKKKTAMTHLEMSKAEMKKGNTAECIKHMEEAHQAMGM